MNITDEDFDIIKRYSNDEISESEMINIITNNTLKGSLRWKIFMETKNSIYCYPGTNILINKLDIHDSNKLFKWKNNLFTCKILYSTRQNNKIQKFDKKHFLDIHYFSIL